MANVQTLNVQILQSHKNSMVDGVLPVWVLPQNRVKSENLTKAYTPTPEK